MTSTSVKDVSTVMKTFVQSAGNNVAANASKTSFQEVWNNQTGKNAGYENAATEASKVDNKGKSDKAENCPGESLKAKDNRRPEVKEAKQPNQPKTGALEEEQLEEAMEVLGTVASELMQQVADTFGMSMEELQKLMEEMNMSVLDMLDSAKFSELLLAAGGAEDTLALLTNEGLCADFQKLMSMQKQIVVETAEALEMTPEQLMQTVEEMNLMAQNADEMLTDTVGGEGATDELPIEIAVEADDIQTDASNKGDAGANALQQNTEEVPLTKADNASQTENGKEQHSENGKEQTGNLLLQNLKNENFQPQLQETAQASSSWDVDTQDIMRQIMDYLKIQIKPDTSSLEMQLHPESLGTVQVHVASKGGLITANFVTENDAVKAVLESQMIQLKESFAEQGVKVEAIEVTVQTHEFERNLDQGRGRQSQEPERKTRTRRINLNASLEMDEAESLNEEEQLVADMMTANGSTVDYTA